MKSMHAFLYIFLLFFLIQPFRAMADNKSVRMQTETPKDRRMQVNPPRISRKKYEENERKYRHLHIRIRQSLPSKHGNITGRLVSPDKVRSCGASFYQAMEKLPDSFVRRSGVRYVCFMQELWVNKKPAGGVASGDTIYLKVNFPAHTVYHELFHVFDPQYENRKWTRLNPKGFLYTGSNFYEIDFTRSKQKQVDDNLKYKRFDNDFVSRYAMSFEREDRASTFACMIDEGPRFLERARKSPVIRQKMLFIIEMTEGHKLMGRDFWEKHLRIKTNDVRNLLKR